MVTAIDHVGFAVRDLDEAVAFYGRAFGLPLLHEEVNEEQGVREAMVGIGDSAIQLLAPLRPDSPIGKFLERNGEGIQQVAFRVSDVDVAGERLRAAGLRLLYDAAQARHGGVPGELRAPQGLRWRARRARRARGRRRTTERPAGCRFNRADLPAPVGTRPG